MSGPKKHVGKTTTGQNVVVVFMQLPGDPAHSLICYVNSLPPRYEDALMSLVNGVEGQSEVVLANLLGRRVFPDTGENVLNALHYGGFLQRLPIERILMTPLPNQSIPLPEVIRLMGGAVPDTVQTPVPQEDAVVKVNPYGQMEVLDASEANRGIAVNLLQEATDLEMQAAQKREQAYRYAPNLRPAPAPPVETADQTKTVTKKAARTRKKAGA